MSRETTSKSMDGITDLVVIAPIKEGFIPAYENVTYATRLKIVAEALNRIRLSAKEYEPMLPFSDVTERILTLLDFRIGVLDRDLFALPVGQSGDGENGATGTGHGPLQSRRFLYLTATFDGAWEPYMRLIWKPLGVFLDILFCNCENYVTAGDHSFEDYARWVRANQVDSSIFYSSTGLTLRDHLYLNRLEQVHRARPAALTDYEIATMTMPRPEEAAEAERSKALRDLQNRDPRQLANVHKLALEALTVLYRLADYYPPEWLAKSQGFKEGIYLIRVTASLLQGWRQLLNISPAEMQASIRARYLEPLTWFEKGCDLVPDEADEPRPSCAHDRTLDRDQVQGGILDPQGDQLAEIKRGALLYMTIADAKGAREFLGSILDQIDFAGASDVASDGASGASPTTPTMAPVPPGGFFRNIAFTAQGLRRIGLPKRIVDQFPKEFREGMEARSGILGDMRENNPRNWVLPERNWPNAAGKRPPIEMSEIDIVLQLRTTERSADELISEIARLADEAGPGVTLQGYQLMKSRSQGGVTINAFGFADGISQPKAVKQFSGKDKDEVLLGDLLIGYTNTRGDRGLPPLSPADLQLIGKRITREGSATKNRIEARDFMFNGSFLVIRKLEQDIAVFSALLESEAKRIRDEHPSIAGRVTTDWLKAHLMGRWPDGKPLMDMAAKENLNDFDYQNDERGIICPHASHIRRANPRDEFQRRPAPRLMRRGMSFDDPRTAQTDGGSGIIFMAYNSSISEQFEAVQRWINGGNSTYVASGHNDPLLGVGPRTGAKHETKRVFRFVEDGEVIRVTMPDPFVALNWGLYLFTPSRNALSKLGKLELGHDLLDPMQESFGLERIRLLQDIENNKVETGREWKRLLEDFDAKDPGEQDFTAHVWSAIRYYYGGLLKIPPIGNGSASQDCSKQDWSKPPCWDSQTIVLAATSGQILNILKDWKNFTTEEQLRRIEPSGIPIFVTQDPDDDYEWKDLGSGLNYKAESTKTNQVLFGWGEEAGFASGYAAGVEALHGMKVLAEEEGDGIGQPYFLEMELRREYLLPALGRLCHGWYGIPEDPDQPDPTFAALGWTWDSDKTKPQRKPSCPGDFLSPSRNAFYPRPGSNIQAFGAEHGRLIHDGMVSFVNRYWEKREDVPGDIAKEMFAAFKDENEKEVLIRNLVGTLIGAIPPMDGNLRGVLLQWLADGSLWRHQAALRNACQDKPAAETPDLAIAVLKDPVSQAICMRPAPDLLYRTVRKDNVTLQRGNCGPSDGATVDPAITLEKRDLVVLSLVSAAQRSLDDKSTKCDVSIVFGGTRPDGWETAEPGEFPVHACPAQKLAMGAMMGILAALLDSGRIQSLSASMIVRITDWDRITPPPDPQNAPSPSPQMPPERP